MVNTLIATVAEIQVQAQAHLKAGNIDGAYRFKNAAKYVESAVKALNRAEKSN